MATIVSRYSDAVTANVPTDQLAPKAPDFTQVQAYQDTNSGAIPQGRTVVTLTWDLPTENEDITGEVLGTADGTQQQFETQYDPIVAGSYTVYEDGTPKTEGTDYSIDLTTGVVTLVAGQFSNGSQVTIDYTTTLQDLDHLEIYRIPGNFPVADESDYATVTGHADVVTVDNNVSATATSYTENLTASENGETWTYYIFAIDDESPANTSVCDAVMIETIPTIPQNLSKTTGDNSVTLSWDSISDDNFDGVNVYRCDGTTFDASQAKKLNANLITGTSFVDGAGNSDRVDSATVPYPVNGQAYSYKIESEDTVTAWDTGTQNQNESQSEITTAVKNV